MHVKRVSKASQNSVWDVPKPFKIEAWDGPGSRNAAVKLHRAAKRQPRASKKAQETPKKCPREARSRPRANQSRSSDAPENTKPFQNPPKTRLEHNLCRKLCWTGSGNDCALFCGLKTKLAICKNHTKTPEKLWFCACAIFSHCRLARTTKHQKK